MGNAAIHKENLIRTAMRLFRRQGYASTGLQQILAESGAPKGSLYHYFPKGKEELAEEVIYLAGGLIRDMLVEHAAKHKEPRAFLHAYCKTMAGWMEESGFRSGCPIATTLLETAPSAPGVTAAGQQAFESWIEVIAGVLKQDGMSGKEATQRARAVVEAMEGALILSRVWMSTGPILDVAKLVS